MDSPKNEGDQSTWATSGGPHSPDDSTVEKKLWSFAPGEKIAGRYIVEQTIGRGAFGEVYRARDEMLGRTIALKTLTLRKSAGDSKGPLQQFLQEARTIANLDHPNIVTVFDGGLERNLPWMAMRHVEGRSLAQVIQEEGKIPVERAVRILRQAAYALEHAHRKGIIHRDVKPSNILIGASEDSPDHVWLADFGIAQILTGDTITTGAGIAGTPSYMSPEQVSGKRIDTRSDLFSLGCIAYEMVTGARSFPGETLTQVMYRVVHEQPERLGELRHIAGSAFEEAVRKALAKSPEDRYPTASALMTAFDAATSSAGAVPVSLWRFSASRLLHRTREGDWDGLHTVMSEEVHKSYVRRKKVLDGIDLKVKTGSIYALLGRNGSGKTTLIRTLIGIYRADSGTVRIFGRNPQREGPAILSRLGYVSDDPPFYGWLKVSDLLQLMSRFYSTWDNTFCLQLLARFDLPLEAKIRDLSKGMKTKVSLLVALAHRPEFLLLDDPTLGLDAVVLQEFFETLKEASHREGTTVFIASHNLEEVEQISSHFGFLKDGRIFLSGSLDELRARTRQVTLTFKDDVPDLKHLENFRPISSSGRRLTGFVLDASSGVLEKLRNFAPEQMEVRQLSLKEIFVNFMR